jgi:hypothetical protein
LSRYLGPGYNFVKLRNRFWNMVQHVFLFRQTLKRTRTFATFGPPTLRTHERPGEEFWIFDAGQTWITRVYVLGQVLRDLGTKLEV